MRFLFFVFFLWTGVAKADPVEIVATEFTKTGDTWRVDVTLRHPDTGWDRYTDAWEILGENGNRLGIRELAHPHVNEQPFTRSLFGVVIPEGAQTVFVRARCNVDGWNADQIAVQLN